MTKPITIRIQSIGFTEGGKRLFLITTDDGTNQPTTYAVSFNSHESVSVYAKSLANAWNVQGFTTALTHGI